VNIFKLINQVQAKGIQLWEEDGQLKLITPEGALTDDLRQQLVNNKSDVIAFLQQISVTNKLPTISPVDRKSLVRIPLSFAQERLWFIDQLEPESTGYNISGAFIVKGEINISQVEQAINIIIARHENLRTIFPSKDGLAEQIVLDEINFILPMTDFSLIKEKGERYEKAREFCRKKANTPFNLAKGPLFKGEAIKLSSDEHILMLNMHHIISDGWSIAVLLKEMAFILNSLDQDDRFDLPPLPIQYVDYSVWQRKWMEKEGILEKQLSYWQDKLSGMPESLDMATDFPRPVTQSLIGSQVQFEVDQSLTEQLKKLTDQYGATLYMTLLSAFKVLLHRYTGQEDICIGSPIANRQFGETEGLIGMFVNTLALRSIVQAEDSFVEVLAKVKNTCLEAYEHQDTPFEKIVDRVQVKRNLAMSPLFQVMVILQNTPMEDGDLPFDDFPIENNVSNFDLTLEFTESDQGLKGRIEYSSAIFKQSTVERICSHFVDLCKAIVIDPNAQLNQLSYIAETEIKCLQVDFNQSQQVYSKDLCIHQLFAEQAFKNPDNIAVVFNDTHLTYKKLYDESAQLALYLQSKGVSPDSLVGLCMDRSLEMVVGILAILLAGGAYVPLDPEYPDDRLRYMLKDCQSSIVLTQEKLKQNLSGLISNDVQLISVDGQFSEIKEAINHLKQESVTLNDEVKPNNLAYVIYTSGSTGQSKGVAVEHQSVINMIFSQIELFAITPNDNCLQNFSVCFDGAVYEMYMALLSGASLIVSPKEAKNDPIKLLHYLKEHQVSIATIIPSFVAAIGEEVLPLRVLITAGESANKEAFKFHTEHNVQCYNAYGPTETSVCATYFKITPESIDANSIPIGIPIANTQIHILDKYNNIVPIGVPGELHIAGAGLARGYLNRPELTKEKFIDNPYDSGTRMYKSGDLARWLDNGNIEYLGRVDTQVKIRGFRIETGEIEAELNQYIEIKDSVVVAQGEANNKQLIAFYQTRTTTADEISTLDNDILRSFLKKSLPEYMLPVAFSSVKTIPLTPNGKVDRRRLEQTHVVIESNQVYQAPSNDTEMLLVSIWADLLVIPGDTIGVNDDFFQLGGNSLLAVQLMAKINNQFQQLLPLSILFTSPNISSLACSLLNKNTESCDILVPIQTRGHLTPIFAVPGAGGNVLSMQPFSKTFGENQPFYGLQSVGFDGQELPLTSLHQTAAINVAAMRKIQAKGPYRLLGHSYGGVVAYEMARVLLEQGEELEYIALLDSIAPLTWQQQASNSELATLIDICAIVGSLYDVELIVDVEQLQSMSIEERIAHIASKLIEHGLDITVEQFSTFYKVFNANEQSYRDYKPERLIKNIPSMLFRAENREQSISNLPNDYGWKELLSDSLKVINVKGDHFSMLDEEYNGYIVQSIKEGLI